MEKFWAVILIFAIVAAGGLLYVNQVYAPQKDAQIAMAETANQTLSAVKVEMSNDTMSSEVSGAEAIQIITGYLENEEGVTIIINGVPYEGDTADIDDKVDTSGQYYMKVIKDDGEITEVRFLEI
ncbi:MAG: hypothetical protein ACYCYE_13030 [Clostridia bacterium]